LAGDPEQHVAAADNRAEHQEQGECSQVGGGESGEPHDPDDVGQHEHHAPGRPVGPVTE
jgi:hypothetical protein